MKTLTLYEKKVLIAAEMIECYCTSHDEGCYGCIFHGNGCRFWDKGPYEWATAQLDNELNKEE